ncbi:MAG: DUF4917 family protein [Gluconobacter sp.]
MTEFIDFSDALRRSEASRRALLVGNGFSARYFNYATLLDQSGLMIGSPLRNVFDRLRTKDFELVIRALEGAIAVEDSYGHYDHAHQLADDAQCVREALVKAVYATHPAHRREIETSYTSSAAFLRHFSTVFSLNYDLLLYWANFENELFTDGFGLGDKVGPFIASFSDQAYFSLYNLHGGLHLFDDGFGVVKKAIDGGRGVVDTIADTIINYDELPIYVAEGTSAKKMRKINSVAYLRHCYDKLKRNDKTMFVFGHSADDNDAHIYRAIFASEARHLYFGVYKPDDEKLLWLDGQLARFQRFAGSSIGYTFFDSESAKVWDS